MTDVVVPATIDQLENLSLNLDVSALATVLTGYVQQGSQKNALSINDLSITMPGGVALGSDASVKDLFDAGSDFFSSLIYQSLTPDLRAKIPPKSPDLADVGRSLTQEMLSLLLFVDYFYIYTQARHPTKEMDDMGRDGRKYKPAQFILNTIGSNKSFADIEKMLFDKGLAKIPMGWVKEVPITNLSIEAQNRFLLGAAGHRLIQAFATIKCIDTAPEDVKKIWGRILKYTQDGYSWNFHTAFRTVAFVRLFKSLNKILENLLATYGDPDDVAQAHSTESKILYRKPTTDSRYKDYSALMRPEFDAFMSTNKIFSS